MPAANLSVWRGDSKAGGFLLYSIEVPEGMVVLDAILKIQAEQAPDLAVRWNCKAGRCGSCSAEINGRPALMCMTRLSALRLDRPVTIEPMRTFPIVKDLVTDVSWNYEVMKGIRKFTPRSPDAPDGSWRMSQKDVDRVQEFRKCIECFLSTGGGGRGKYGRPGTNGCSVSPGHTYKWGARCPVRLLFAELSVPRVIAQPGVTTSPLFRAIPGNCHECVWGILR